MAQEAGEADTLGRFELAVGTATGRVHRRAGRGGQDACWVERAPGALVALVADGCGDPASPHSEVGAALGARLVARALAARAGEPAEAALEHARLETLAQIAALAGALGDPPDAIRRYFLFTVVGARITAAEAVFFAIGDGLIVVNETPLVLGPYPDNAPPYLAYALIPGHPCAAAGRFAVQAALPPVELRRFMLGTDGALPVLDPALTVPGRATPAGGADRLLADDLLFRNPEALANRLRLLATDSERIDWAAGRKRIDPGRLPDDATLILGRQRPAAREAADG